MPNYTNKIEREPQERSSNIELLRILSMFLVLMIHYIPSRTLPTHDTLAHDTLGTLFDLELRSISFVCVNCFILIEVLETDIVNTKIIINEKQKPKKNNILTGLTIPNFCAIQSIKLGKQSNINTPIPTSSHANAYLSSNLFFLIIFTITTKAPIINTAIII